MFKKKLKPDETIYKYMQTYLLKAISKYKMLIIWYLFFITKIASIRMLFVIAYVYKLVGHQMNVKIVFLNVKEIYMEQPKGLVIPGQENWWYPCID